MEDFNIAEALKYAPKGLPLYSPIFGEVNLSEVSGDSYPIEVKWIDKSYKFTEHGRYFDGKGECLLFPSKDHRTWDNWQSVIFPQSVGTVCVYTPKPTMFLCTENGTLYSDGTGNTWNVVSEFYLNHCRYASPEEVQQFFDKLKANGYEWDAEKKKLRKLQSDKFDISTLQPFDKVLVRDSKDEKWNPNIFSFYLSDSIDFRFRTITDSWRYCIPYNDDTKHLVGTTDDAPEFYKTWEYDE